MLPIAVSSEIEMFSIRFDVNCQMAIEFIDLISQIIVEKI